MTEKEICQKICDRFQSTHSLMKSTRQMDPNYVHVGKPLLFAPISDNDNDYAAIRKKDILIGDRESKQRILNHPGTQEFYQYTYDHMEEYSKITERTDRTTFITNAANYFIENDYQFLHVENEEVVLFKQMTEKEICQKLRERFQSTHSLMKSNPKQGTRQMDPNYVHVGKPLLFAPISDNDNTTLSSERKTS
jgi:hypothetical protein